LKEFGKKKTKERKWECKVKNGKWMGSLEVKGEKWGIENFPQA